MKIAGIDPGRKGYLAILEEGRPVIFHPLPYIEDALDALALASLIKIHRPEKIAVEQPQMRSQGQSMTHATTSYHNHGKIIGMLEAIEWNFCVVPVQTWQAVIHRFSNPGTEGSKLKSLEAARKLFPNETFLATKQSRVVHDGETDSALIALWLRLQQISK